MSRFPLELGQATELAGPEQIPVSVRNDGAASSITGRNVTHEESRGQCNDPQDDVDEVGDYELAPVR